MSGIPSFVDSIIVGDNVAVLKTFPDNCIDLTVTSPPYDNLRKYQGFTWDFEGVAQELYRVTKPGGAVVWVVSDGVEKTRERRGSESGTSFRQALYFMSLGFLLYDTMIWYKLNYIPTSHPRYEQKFEYMFVFSKGRVKSFNGLRDPSINAGLKRNRRSMNSASTKEHSAGGRGRSEITVVHPTKLRGNVWEIPVGFSHDKEAFKQPAIFPEKLAEDHILSWSNPGDIVLDPFLGSGTTAKMAVLNGRHYVGIDCSSEYVEGIARPRVEAAKAKMAEEASRPQQGRLSV